MLVSAAVCPHPPALVPAISQGAAARLADLRTACLDAVARLRNAEPDVLLCVGAGPQTRSWGPDAGGTLSSFGVDVGFGGSETGLPLSLTIAAYLLMEAGVRTCDGFYSIAQSASPDACRSLGADLAEKADRVVLLVMGDGSARRTNRSPGPFDERADAFDADVLRALTGPDPQALLDIDPEPADDLWVAGRPAWQVLAGALHASPVNWVRPIAYSSAPLGVGYFVVQLESLGSSG
jgi:hypothetical protein